MNFDDLIITSSAKYRTARRGFAPVEMTLVTPMLMLIMAVIIAFGFNATWKLRTEAVARDVTWRNRTPHTGVWNTNRETRNPEWPEARDSEEIANASDGRDSAMTVFGDDDVLHWAIIRGPIQNINVDSEILNFARTVDDGVAALYRKPSILGNVGRIDFRTHFTILSDQFRFSEMGGHQAGFWGNYARRFPMIYETELDHLEERPEFISAHQRCQSARDPLCLALDEDEEFFNWYQNRCRIPDFHPRVSYFLSFDHEWVQRRRVDPVLGSIERVPFSMGNATIRLYREMIASETLSDAEVAQLERKIEDIENWLDSIRE